MDIEKLKKEEKQLSNKLYKIRDQREQIQRETLRPKLEKKYVGKFFKCRNSYGSGDKGWWLYSYVISLPKNFNIPNPVFYIYSFQMTTRSGVEIQTHDITFSYLFEQEITRKEFMTAYQKMLKKIEFKENKK